MSDNRRLAMFVPSFGDGGVERMLVNLAHGLIAEGLLVDLLLSNESGPYLDLLPADAKRFSLGTGALIGTLLAFTRYLRAARPAAVLCAKERANRSAVWARRLAGVSTRLVFRVGTTTSAKLAGRGALKRWYRYRTMRRVYAQADTVIAVSQGVAADLSAILHLPGERIRVIPNPVVTPALYRLAAEAVDHPWLTHKQWPLIVSVGRLTRAKDYPTLLRAFARVRKVRPCRLMILGKGRQQHEVEALATRLGIAEDLALPGFTANPYAYLARADLFVLSSVWEGSPNALTEALALGIPAVATDCPSGPREILHDGRYGRLVPVGDPETLARAMLTTLDHPPESAALRAAVRRYTLEESSKRYAAALGFAGAMQQ